MATLYKATGERKDVYPKNGKYFTLSELQGFVGGLVEMFPAGRGRMLVVNEEARILNMPINMNATRMVRQFGYVPMFGDVLYCKENDIYHGELD